jgi:ribose transport system permease protein
MATSSVTQTLAKDMQRLLMKRGFWLNTAFPVVALLVMVGVFSVAAPSFLSLANLDAMTGVWGPLLVACLGGTFVIVMGSIDLSVGSIVLLTGAVVARVLAGTNLSVEGAVLLGVLVGAGCGLVNGLVYAYGKVPSFVTTLGTLSVFAGIGLILINGSPLPFDSPLFSALAYGHVLPHIQNAALWAIIVWGVMVLVAFRTRFGIYMYAIGGGERVARLSGIKVDRYKVYAFILSGGCAGLSGVLSVAQLGSGGPTLGSTLLLDSLAAIVVGGTALSGGVGGVHRTLLGVLIITVLSDGLDQLGIGTFTQSVIKGLVIILAVTITMVQHRRLIIK